VRNVGMDVEKKKEKKMIKKKDLLCAVLEVLEWEGLELKDIDSIEVNLGTAFISVEDSIYTLSMTLSEPEDQEG
jgi:hypothetical protein